MATTVAERIFVDTNVLVYASRRHSSHHIQAVRLLGTLSGGCKLPCLSRQIIREYLAAVTRSDGKAAALPMAVAIAEVQRLSSLFAVLEDNAAVTGTLLDLLLRYPTAGRQVHDANIVATMVVHEVRRLLTFNTSDFQRFSSLIDLEPA
jgi:predicted nucleic acid-binding protein